MPIKLAVTKQRRARPHSSLRKKTSNNINFDFDFDMKTYSLFLSTVLSLSSAAIAGELVGNGSFESPDVSTVPGHVDRTPGSWLTFAPNASGLPSWQILSAPISITRMPYNEGFETLLAGDGVQAAGLTGENFNGLGGLEQTVTTTPGRDYALAFQLGTYPGSSAYHGPVRVQVSAGTTSAEFRHDGTVAVAGGLWQAFALPFRAVTDATVIRFQNLEAAHWCGLDRVSIVETPAANSTPNPVLLSSVIGGGGGTSASNDRRLSLSGTIGQPDAGLRRSDPVYLFGGFWGPGVGLTITHEGSFARVSWTFGLGFSELQTTDQLHEDPSLNVWTPVSLAGSERSVIFPASGAMRFFRAIGN